MMRIVLCIGDKPETGGDIEQDFASRSPTISGSCVAFIGSKSFCNACKSSGLIEKSGGPSRRKHGEREIALDGDILRCLCTNPPKMKATVQSMSRHDDNVEHLGPVISGQRSQTTNSPFNDLQFDEQVRIIDSTEFQDYPYQIDLPGGQTIKGALSKTGKLPRVSTESCGDTYYINWGDEALSRR